MVTQSHECFPDQLSRGGKIPGRRVRCVLT